MNKGKGKTLNLVIEEFHDSWGASMQGIGINEFGIDFDVYDLSECPEDAIIGRDLFDAKDYIKALKKGIELAQMGYTDIEYTIVEVEERW